VLTRKLSGTYIAALQPKCNEEVKEVAMHLSPSFQAVESLLYRVFLFRFFMAPPLQPRSIRLSFFVVQHLCFKTIILSTRTPIQEDAPLSLHTAIDF